MIITSLRPEHRKTPTSDPLRDHIALLAARLLRRRGILVVLTHSDWSHGELVDPTGRDGAKLGSWGAGVGDMYRMSVISVKSLTITKVSSSIPRVTPFAVAAGEPTCRPVPLMI